VTKPGLHNPMAAAVTRRCPICGKPASARHRPFCSPRCADIDLGRWLKGNYRITSEEEADADAPEEAGETEQG
jgi:uncharacterized protein